MPPVSSPAAEVTTGWRRLHPEVPAQARPALNPKPLNPKPLNPKPLTSFTNPILCSMPGTHRAQSPTGKRFSIAIPALHTLSNAMFCSISPGAVVISVVLLQVSGVMVVSVDDLKAFKAFAAYGLKP